MKTLYLRVTGAVAGLLLALAAVVALAAPATGQTVEQKLPYTAGAARDPDGTPTTVGTKFTTAKAGKVVGVEFFRVDNQNKATTVQLWGAGTTALATASGVPAGNGWVRANFPAPVAVAAGTTYTASYFAPSGKYSVKGQGWSAGRSAGDLAAPVGAGVYRQGSPAGKPTSVFNAEDYYVTPVFVADPVAPPTTTTPPPPTTTTTTPPPPPPAGAWPNPGNTGVPAGWVPAQTLTAPLHITTPGAVVEDVRLVNASLLIDAPNVTVRRVEVQGGAITNFPGNTCQNGLLLEDVSVIRAPGQVTSGDEPAVSVGGYTARRVKIDGLPEGFRVGGSPGGCGAVTVEDSFARVRYPDQCADWHGDGLQGYDGGALTVRHSTLDLIMSPSCGGTGPFFYPHSQGNTSANIDGLLVKGGGFSFRLGMPGTVTGLKIVDGAWVFGPIDVKCSVLPTWQADIVTIDADYQPTAVRAQPCNTESGN